MNSETSFFLCTLYTTVQEYKYGEENVNNKVIFTVWEKRPEKIFAMKNKILSAFLSLNKVWEMLDLFVEQRRTFCFVKSIHSKTSFFFWISCKYICENL